MAGRRQCRPGRGVERCKTGKRRAGMGRDGRGEKHRRRKKACFVKVFFDLSFSEVFKKNTVAV